MDRADDGREAEFEQRFADVLEGKFKSHRPANIRRRLEVWEVLAKRRARRHKGKDLEKFKMAVSDLEIILKLKVLLAEVLREEAA